MIAMIGADPQTGTLRWTMDSLYLWDGLPLVPLLLGVFALPELCDLLIARVAISSDTSTANIYKGQWQGVKDYFQNWWLIMRCSWIGGGIGSIPGSSARRWSTGWPTATLKTEKGASQTFGKGDVRGVIASEDSNNAKEGRRAGSDHRVRRVPGSAHGHPARRVPDPRPGAGPRHADQEIQHHLFDELWSVALANILGAGMCYAFQSAVRQDRDPALHAHSRPCSASSTSAPSRPAGNGAT